MFSKIFNRLSYYKACSRLAREGRGGLFYASSDTRFVLRKGSKIRIAGNLMIGVPLPGSIEYPSAHKTLVLLEENAELICNGDVFFANGCSILVGAGKRLVLGGDNCFDHDTMLFCNHQITIGRGSRTSWGCTLIDFDGHYYAKENSRRVRRVKHPLLIGDHVGVQMGVMIPSGVVIGDNAAIGANSVVRQNIPANSIAYSEAPLRIHQGTTSGLQFKKNPKD